MPGTTVLAFEADTGVTHWTYNGLISACGQKRLPDDQDPSDLPDVDLDTIRDRRDDDDACGLCAHHIERKLEAGARP